MHKINQCPGVNQNYPATIPLLIQQKNICRNTAAIRVGDHQGTFWCLSCQQRRRRVNLDKQNNSNHLFPNVLICTCRFESGIKGETALDWSKQNSQEVVAVGASEVCYFAWHVIFTSIHIRVLTFCLWFWQNSPTQFPLRQMARLQSMLPRYSVYTQVLVLYCIFSDASNLTFFVFESCWGHHCGDMIVATSLQQRRYGCIIAAASLLYQGVIAAALLLKHIGGIAQKISYSYHCFKCSESLQISDLISSMCKFHNTQW